MRRDYALDLMMVVALVRPDHRICQSRRRADAEAWQQQLEHARLPPKTTVCHLAMPRGVAFLLPAQRIYYRMTR